MAAYRQIHTKIWGDCWFFRLTTVEKAVFIYLFSNERACLAGLYEIPIEIIATETGVTVGEAQEILEKFAADGKAIYEDGWVWVPSLLRYNAENITSPKIQAHLHKWVAGVSGDVVLKNRWIDSYNSIVDKQYRIDTLSIPKLSPHTWG
jgi:hypothetical protein